MNLKKNKKWKCNFYIKKGDNFKETMASPETNIGSNDTEGDTRWDDMRVGAEFLQVKEEPLRQRETETYDERLNSARANVVKTYTSRPLDLLDDKAEKEKNFVTKVNEIDSYLTAHTEEHRANMALYMADLAGVLIDVKPAALIQISPVDLGLDPKKAAEMINGLGLKVALGQHDGQFFVSKNEDVAEQLKQGFYDLWENNQTKNVEERVMIDRKLGKLLGYPETAVNQDLARTGITRASRIKNFFRKHQDDALSRHYVHSAAHQYEEFEQYEKPIHEFLDKYCPESAKILKNEKNAKGKPYKW